MSQNESPGPTNDDADLQRSELRYRNLFQTTGVGIWECDFSAVRERIDGLLASGVTDLERHMRQHPGFVREAIEATRCIDVNEASVRIFRARSKGELLGSCGWVWPSDSEHAYAASLLAARSAKASFDVETVLNARDGSRLDVLLSTAFPPESASRESIFVTVTDLTARNEAQAALRSAEAELIRAMRLTTLGQMAASIAHELNQPLASILANAQAGLRWLGRDEPNVQAAQRSMELLEEEARRARNVISGVRSLARNELPSPESIDINHLVEETLALLSYELGRRGFTVRRALDDSLPPLQIERTQMQQVLINLVLNAVQAVESTSSPDRVIIVGTEAADDVALVRVEDRGPGIDRDIQDKLFSPFATTRREGVGLGLAICRSIVERHGGRIWWERKPTSGTILAFTIPIPRPKSHSPDAGQQPGAANPAP